MMNDLNETAENLRIVQLMLENGHAGHWDVVRPFVSDQLVMHVPRSLPFGGDYHGWQGYMNVLNAIGTFFTEIKSGPRDFATVGDKVIVTGTLSCRIAANGRNVAFPLTDIWRLKGEQVVEITAFYYDTKEIVDLAAA
jgi:SnoaL-like domain